MEDIFRKLILQEREINIDGEKLTDMRFVDDVALVTTSVTDMEVHLNTLNQGSKKSEDVIVVEDDVIEKVDGYKYIGQTVKMEDNTRKEALIRIKAGWSCFYLVK
ncbi:uncharacterized protein [Amphiura filiformis]|uniref:uncharacterized protein n=1 Tax=Amphiura filiformis TaxID=82378 RepID=UPI003B21A107